MVNAQTIQHVKTRGPTPFKLIDSQAASIEKLQDDVDRMAKGCGADGCHWKFR
jgi:hypothetical protein